MPQPRKRFAQHWLKSEKALNQIVSAAALSSSDRLLEIGPGTGILTRRLLTQVASVLAVELDRDLCVYLVKKLGNVENFLLLQGDFLALDIVTETKAFPTFAHPNKVVANIPYNITGPILEKLLGTISQPRPNPYDLIILLIQKEVAQRLSAQPDSKAFGALSVKVQYLADCELVADVPATAFQPPPKVDSAIIRLCPRKMPVSAANPPLLEKLLKMGFASKRKMLRNNLQGFLDRDETSQILQQLNLDSQARAEDISVSDWVSFANLIHNLKFS